MILKQAAEIQSKPLDNEKEALENKYLKEINALLREKIAKYEKRGNWEVEQNLLISQ